MNFKDDYKYEKKDNEKEVVKKHNNRVKDLKEDEIDWELIR